MNCRFSSLLVLCIPLFTGCIQKLDDQLGTGGAMPVEPTDLPPCPSGQPFACHFTPNLQTPDIGLADNDGEVTDAAPPTNGCKKVVQDTLAVITAKCASCHVGGVQSPLTNITTLSALNVPSPTSTFQGMLYVVPGKPEQSLIYVRAVINRDMPQRDRLAADNGLTISEASVLREWILACASGQMSSAAPVATSTGGTGAGGTSAGGTSAGGTGAGGAGGAGGTGAAGMSAGGTGAGGAGAGGTGGAGLAPCSTLCANPMIFTAPFQSNNLGQAAACYETTSALTSFTCMNNNRGFNINGTAVDCALPTLPPPRNGGYCVRTRAGNNNMTPASFTAN